MIIKNFKVTQYEIENMMQVYGSSEPDVSVFFDKGVFVFEKRVGSSTTYSGIEMHPNGIEKGIKPFIQEVLEELHRFGCMETDYEIISTMFCQIGPAISKEFKMGTLKGGLL